MVSIVEKKTIKFDDTKEDADSNELEIIQPNKETGLGLPSKDWTKELRLVKELTAKQCSDNEFKLMVYTARLYGLNPLRKEIYAIKYYGAPAAIMVSRDGLLNIAHRSGQFGSMETTCEVDEQGKPVSATCIVWRKDFDKPFKVIVYFEEFDQKQALWKTKPKTMIMKVAEAFALRRAFNISGVYSPEEFAEHEEVKKNGEGKDNPK